MIRIKHLTKRFGDTCAVNNVSLEIPEGILYGLLGTNGAGKSTLLRLAAGILQADEGEVYVDDKLSYENPEAKSLFFYLPDTPYYFPNATMEEMARFYKDQYPGMDLEGVSYMAEKLNLDVKQPLRTFSKGMKRQAFLILALCANTKYLLCDEVFDGLDPMITELMKKLMHEEMEERKFTVVVVSHKLRELEDICEKIGILHKGGLVTSGELKGRMGGVKKFQCVFPEEEMWEMQEQYLRERLEVVQCRREGSFVTLIVREKEDSHASNADNAKAELADTEQIIKELSPVFVKEVPMTLEETFLIEMEESGYDIRKVLE